MRKLIVLGGLAAALSAPAVAMAQATSQIQLDDLRAQQQAAERRSIDQSNQFQAMEARARADQAAADLATQRAGVVVPQRRYVDPVTGPGTAPDRTTGQPSNQATTAYPSVPDATLADSNKRVQDAVKDRR